LCGYEKGGVTLKTKAMVENIVIIDTFTAQETNFIATATKLEVAIWTVGEGGFEEML
jgi:hypothetical protein